MAIIPEAAHIGDWLNVTNERIESPEKAHAMARVEHTYREAAREYGELSYAAIAKGGVKLVMENGKPIKNFSPEELTSKDVGTMFHNMAVDLVTNRGPLAVEEAAEAFDTKQFAEFEAEFSSSTSYQTV